MTDSLAAARRCDCSLCRRRGAIEVPAPLDGLTLTKGADNLTLHQWEMHAAAHWFRRTSGSDTHHRRRSHPKEYGVNVAILKGAHPRDLSDAPWVDGINHPADKA